MNTKDNLKKEIEVKPIMLEFGKWTSLKDIEDLKMLLEDIREKYHFRWFIHTYYDEYNKDKEISIGKSETLKQVFEEIKAYKRFAKMKEERNEKLNAVECLDNLELTFEEKLKELDKTKK